MADTVTVPAVKVEIKSAWASKINWSLAITVVSLVLNELGILDTPINVEGEQGIVQAAITALGGIAIWYFRNFQNGTVNLASLTQAQKDAVTTMKVAK